MYNIYNTRLVLHTKRHSNVKHVQHIQHPTCVIYKKTLLCKTCATYTTTDLSYLQQDTVMYNMDNIKATTSKRCKTYTTTRSYRTCATGNKSYIYLKSQDSIPERHKVSTCGSIIAQALSYFTILPLNSALHSSLLCSSPPLSHTSDH
jgi:hypothetical protein